MTSFPPEALELLRTGIPGLQTLWLFGSRAGDDCRPDSDWDLAFLAEAPLGGWMLLDLRARLVSVVGSEVDLVDLRAASTVLATEVLRADRLLMDLDPFVRETFEMRTLTQYQDLNEARKGILEDLGMAA